MKKTKRFLALILALILATSGILSGIPGGGVARAEESSGGEIAPLGQVMAGWDVGTEIVGEETVADTAGEPWAEDPSSSAVMEEKAEDSSTIIDEESEDREKETLTDTVFGEYDPASAAETGFDEDANNYQTDGLVGVEETNGKSVAYAEEEESGEEEFRGLKSERLAGDTTYHIYFTYKSIKDKTMYSNTGWDKDGNVMYYNTDNNGDQSHWGNTDPPIAMQYEGQITDGDKTYSYFSATITTSDTYICFSGNKSRHNDDNETITNYDSKRVGAREVTSWIELQDGYTYFLNSYFEGDNHNYHQVGKNTETPAPPTPPAPELTLTPAPSITEASENALVLYYDASLSIIVRDSQENRWKMTLPYRSLPNSGGAVAHTSPVYLVVGEEYYVQTTPLTNAELKAAPVSRDYYQKDYAANTVGGYLYKFVVDRTKFGAGETPFYFTTDTHSSSNVGNNNTADPDSIATDDTSPNRTADLKLPKGEYSELTTTVKTITHNCFYGDTGDAYIYDTTSARGGYWDKVKGPRDPEKRALAKAEFSYTPKEGGSPLTVTASDFFNNVVPDGAKDVQATIDLKSVAMVDTVVNINDPGDSVPETTPVPANGESGQKVLDVTLYDYYTDYELNGKNRDDYPQGREFEQRGYYTFMSLNNAMSAKYTDKDEDVALYSGHFQRDSYNSGIWSSLASYGNWLYSFYSHSADASEYRKFLSHNNSTVKYNGELTDNNPYEEWERKYHTQAVSWGLVDDNIKEDGADHTEGVGLYTNNKSMLLPYFDDTFINGDNALNTKLGKVYNNVKFPFSIERRKNKNNSNLYVDYYVFAARTDLMSTSWDYISSRIGDTKPTGDDDSKIKVVNTQSGWRWVGKGDAALLRRKGDEYYVKTWVDTQVEDHYNVENIGAEQKNQYSMGFFPFNEDLSTTKKESEEKDGAKYNYGYGMKFETTFKMRRDGMVLAKKANGDYYNPAVDGGTIENYLTPMKFRFSGDDDVWIFIDGKLVLDLGGDHTAAEGEIWFGTDMDSSIGSVPVLNNPDKGDRPNGPDKWVKYIDKAGFVKMSPKTPTAEKTGSDVIVPFQFSNEDYDADDHSGAYGIHTLTMYYMERGMWDSNMMIEFNLESYPADSPKVDLVLKKDWAPASSASSEASFIVLCKDPEANVTSQVNVNGQKVFTIKNPETSYTIKDREAFVDGDKTKQRFIYEVYEIDEGYDVNKGYDEKVNDVVVNAGHYHLVGIVGGGTDATTTFGMTQTGRTGDISTAGVVTDSCSFELDLDGSGTVKRYYTLSGTAECTEVPYFYQNADTLKKNHDGKYVYTATNASAAVTVEKSWKYWDGDSYEAMSSSVWKPVKVQLQRRVRAAENTGIGAWAAVPAASILDGDNTVTLTSGTLWKHTFVLNDPYYASDNLYEYRVVELKTGDALLEEGEASYYYADDSGGDSPTYHVAEDFTVHYGRSLSSETAAASSKVTTTITSPQTVDNSKLDTDDPGVTYDLLQGTAGTYQLADSVTLTKSGGITLAGDIIIDINGHNLTLGTGTKFIVPSGKTLTICDTSTNQFGKIYTSTTFADVTGGTVNFKGGTIDGSAATSGGAFNLSSGTLNISGTATVRNTKATNGGAVYVGSSATFNMTGGSIKDCEATGKGGGVYVEAGGTLSLSGTNLKTFRGNVAGNTTSSTMNGGAIYNAGTLTMQGDIDIGDGIATAANKHMDSVCLADISWTGSNNWIQIGGALQIVGDGYVDLETSLPSVSGVHGSTVAKNNSPAEGQEGHISAETFCEYGRFFINSAQGLTVSGGYDYQAEENLDPTTHTLKTTPAATDATFTAEDYYPYNWATTTVTPLDTNTPYAYVNALGDLLQVHALTAETNRVYQSESYLIYAQGKTHADQSDWNIIITNRDEPIAAYAVYTRFLNKTTQIAYSATSDISITIATVLQRRALTSSASTDTKARSDSDYEYKSLGTAQDNWDDSNLSPAWVDYTSSLTDDYTAEVEGRRKNLSYLPGDTTYYGWRGELVEYLPARSAYNIRYEYRFTASPTVTGYNRGNHSKWFINNATSFSPATVLNVTGLRSLSGAPSTTSSYDTNVYRADFTDVPGPLELVATKLFLDESGAKISSFSRTPTIYLQLQNSTDGTTFTAVNTVTLPSGGDGSGGSYTKTWSNLDKAASDGTFYYYRVVEVTNDNSDSEHPAQVIADGAIVAFNDGYSYEVEYSQTASSDPVKPGISNTTNQVDGGTTSVSVNVGNKVQSPDFEVVKFDENSGSLGGATFSLRSSPYSTATPQQTSDASTGKLTFTNLSPGTYRLYEDAAPKGHTAQPGYLEVVIAADGTMTFTANDGFTHTVGTPTAATGSANRVVSINVSDPRETVTLTVMKEWKRHDNENDSSSLAVVPNTLTGGGENTNLPAQIYVKLQRSTDGSSWADVPIGNVTTTGKAGSSDAWPVTVLRSEYTNGHVFSDLEKYNGTGTGATQYQYRFVETNADGTVLTSSDAAVPFDSSTTPNAATYSWNLSSGAITISNNAGSQTLTNIDNTVSAKVTKQFAGADASTVHLGLYRKIDSDSNWTLVNSFSLSSGNLVQTFSNYPSRDANGYLYSYRFFELTANGGTIVDGSTTKLTSDGFRVEYGDVSSVSGFDFTQTITNKKALVDLTVTKDWKYIQDDGTTGDIPSGSTLLKTVKFKVSRTASGTPTWARETSGVVSWETTEANATIFELTSANSWTKTLSNLDAYVDISADTLVEYTFAVYEIGSNASNADIARTAALTGTATDTTSQSGVAFTIGGKKFTAAYDESGSRPDAVGDAKTTLTGTITNTLNETVEAKVEKTWTNVTPVTVKMELARKKGESGTWESFDFTDHSDSVSGKTIVTLDTSTTTATISGLPRYASDGDEYTYKYFELDSSDERIETTNTYNGDFKVQYTGSWPQTVNPVSSPASGNTSGIQYLTTVTNLIEKVTATLTKTWVNASNTGLPATMTYKLIRTTLADFSGTDPSTHGYAVYTYTITNSNGSLTVTETTSGGPFTSVEISPTTGGNAAATWTLTVSNLLKEKTGTHGATYHYKFVEVGSDNSELPVNSDPTKLYGFVLTTLGTPSIGADGNTTQAMTNTKQVVDAVLTKVWNPATTTANSIKVKLQRTSGAWTGNVQDVGIYTITKSEGTLSVATDTPTGSPTAPTATLPDGNTVWKIQASNLDKFDLATGTAYKYRFVEMDGTTPVAHEGVVDGFKVDYGTVTGTNFGEATLSGSTFSQTITNTPASVKIEIMKIVSGTYGSDPRTYLAGAVFKLKKVLPTTDSDYNVERTFAETGSDGKAAMPSEISDGIGDGTYELWESVAPAGYAMHSGKVTFHVSGGEIEILDSENAYAASGLVEASLTAAVSGKRTINSTHITTGADGVKTYSFVFENTSGTELPGTGTVFGLSRMGFASLGTVLLAAFVVVYQYKKRRQYNGEDEEN